MSAVVDKNRPSESWIASLRERFVIEHEIDRVLTRKLKLRSGPPFVPVPLETLAERVTALIRSHIGSNFRLADARWLSGGASKLQMAFTLEWERPGIGREQTPMVLRMEPAESIVETSRRREFELIRAMQGTVPVPPVYWCDADAAHLPYPGLIYGFANGVTKPSNAQSGVSGLGTHLPEALRQKLAPQFVDHLAKIHTFDVRSADLPSFQIPGPGTQCAEWGVSWWERVWEEDAQEDSPLLRLAAGWLRENAPSLDRPVIVHADFRTGNFLYTEHDSRISAWLDWELGRIGDRHQDLAWTTNRAFGHLDQDGKTFLVCGLMTEQALFDAYQERLGLSIDRKTLHWYKVYNSFMFVTLILGTSYRVARAGKTHQDVLVTWALGLAGMLQAELLELLEAGG